MLSRLLRAVILLLAVVAVPCAALADLSPDLKKALADSTYVYISSARKSGGFGEPAEIWFMYHGGAVYVGTRPTSWRVRRIKAGRPAAKIAVGSTGGPSFEATGSIDNDPAAQELLLKTFAQKYAERWPSHEKNFRDGFQDGSRVLVKYVPKD
jgi:hypothetical protein